AAHATLRVKLRGPLQVVVVGVALLCPTPDTYAHRSGCHRWHSCPSDTGSYVSGDTGYCSGCPDNQYCSAGKPTRAATEEPTSQRNASGYNFHAGIQPKDAWTCPTDHPIKGNFTTYSGERCIYHPPSGAFYSKTKPERCYASDEEARQDGCRKSKR